MVLTGHFARWVFLALFAATGAIFTSVQLVGIRVVGGGILLGSPSLRTLLLLLAAAVAATTGPESGEMLRPTNSLLLKKP